MCGIAGVFSQRTLGKATVARMLDALRKRGPDAQHHVSWDENFRPASEGVCNALVHTRLSIIDPRPEADQPMVNDAGDVWICYNGEVYDWQQDAAALKRQGVVFRTRSDTEYILRAYETRGIDCLQRLRGMFAFAIVDLRRRQVFVARDRMGLKPVVYSYGDGEFGFGSTVRSLLPALASKRRGFSRASIDAYLAHRYVPAPGTVFAHAQRLENGHYLRFDLRARTLEKFCYWRPTPRAGEWFETLDQAIAMRTVADRPVGVFLSGGIDSSVIACRLAAQGRTDLMSFTAAFPGTHFDESGEATQTAALLGIRNQGVAISISMRDDFARIVADLDEPFADPSCLPTWYLSLATAQQVKVVLGGDGGDELFAGYKRFAKHLGTHWRAGWQLPWLPLPASMSDRGFVKICAELRMPWLEAYALRFSGFSPQQRRFLAGGAAPLRLTHWRLPDNPSAAPLESMLEVDRLNYLPEYILRKADLCTMAHGLELRAPLLDHQWYETILALAPAKRFTRPAKLLLAPALRPIAALRPFERKKRGFNPPLARWLREDLAGRFPGTGTRLARLSDGLLDARCVDAMLHRYGAGDEGLGEGVLQLLLLDESLTQLDALRRETHG
jgi:asparagine synthase (glutamine-hydrolysing)